MNWNLCIILKEINIKKWFCWVVALLTFKGITSIKKLNIKWKEFLKHRLIKNSKGLKKYNYIILIYHIWNSYLFRFLYRMVKSRRVKWVFLDLDVLFCISTFWSLVLRVYLCYSKRLELNVYCISKRFKRRIQLQYNKPTEIQGYPQRMNFNDDCRAFKYLILSLDKIQKWKQFCLQYCLYSFDKVRGVEAKQFQIRLIRKLSSRRGRSR